MTTKDFEAAFFELLKEELKEGKEVYIPFLGFFKVVRLDYEAMFPVEEFIKGKKPKRMNPLEASKGRFGIFWKYHTKYFNCRGWRLKISNSFLRELKEGKNQNFLDSRGLKTKRKSHVVLNMLRKKNS